jgi:hypothetical protein
MNQPHWRNLLYTYLAMFYTTYMSMIPIQNVNFYQHLFVSLHHLVCMSQNNSVCIVIGCRLPTSNRGWDICLHHQVKTSSVAYQAFCPLSTRDPFLEVKWTGHEADHSLPSNAKVKNVWNYASTPPYVVCLHGVVIITCFNEHLYRSGHRRKKRR